VTSKQALRFVEEQGIVLESARGAVPNLASTVAGETIRGSYWRHPKTHEIFRCIRAVRASPDVLVCRLVEGTITYVHRRLWPALAKLAQRFDQPRLAAVREIHTASGAHRVQTTPFSKWISADIRRAAAQLSQEQAAAELRPLLGTD
jgi:hypothetical protein